MEYNSENKTNDSDIVFSRSVKAGKRLYYIDVKRDRKGDYYISMTESKRVKDAGDGQRPVYEKHKIFLYREDLDKFRQAFDEAAEFTQMNAPLMDYTNDWSGPNAEDEKPRELADESDMNLMF